MKVNTNQEFKWGILGTGKMAQDFVVALQNVSGNKIVGVGSRTKSSAEAFALKNGIPHYFGTYEDLIRLEEIQIIYIATTNNFHKENALLSIRSGKHILVEKPFALNFKEAKEVLSLAKEKRVFCMEAMWTRFLPIINWTKKIIDSGELGEIKMINANFGKSFKYQKENRFFNKNLGGGALLDLLVYPVSITQFLLGNPSSIKSESTIAPTGVDEQTSVILIQPNGTIANLQASLVTELSNEIYIFGTKGNLKINAPLIRPESGQVTKFQPFDYYHKSQPSSFFQKLKGIKQIRRTYHKLNSIRQIFQDNISKPFTGSGYEYEIKEVMSCINQGEIESEIMPHSDTLSILKTLDTIREQQ